MPDGSLCAGITFAMLRITEGLARGVDPLRILADRLADISRQLPELGLSATTIPSLVATLNKIDDALRGSRA